MGLIAEFTAGNHGVRQSLGRMWKNEPSLGEKTGIDQAMFTYIGKAMTALKEAE